MARTILGRLSQLLRANVNALIDSAEDPEKMLDQLVRDFTNSITEAEAAVAQSIGNLRLLEDDRDEARSTAEEWGNKAAAAARRADQLRDEDPGEADRFDELAKIALRKQISFEQQADSFAGQITQQTEMVDKLKDGLEKIRRKREELVAKRDELVSRSRMAEAQTRVQEAVRSVSVLDPTSELGRFEERIRREEARVRGMEEVTASSIDSQFEELDELGDDLEVERRLQALRGPS
ncbi:PspA/IM30 family protein [Egicoccus halophilus]|uniref:Phage shock protein A n=1 Tax=Egicoccus halophilus TaxID=1670830 RepID=A0A8J3ABQ0_9ACTN|nr:PspA/IM30 family protein [Egicoccus halophilus]GGI07728.1 phage shock protein A [Egicoccus halophilus]